MKRRLGEVIGDVVAIVFVLIILALAVFIPLVLAGIVRIR